VWPAAALVALMFMASTLVTPLYVLYQQVFGFSDLTLTLIYAAYVLGNLAALLFLGRLSDEIGRRRTALPAIALAILSTALFLFARGTAWLACGRALSGFAIGLASGAGTAWITELLKGGDKARAALIATTANFIGLAIGALLAGCLAQYAPWPLELPFAVYLAALLLLAIVINATRETVANPARLAQVSLRPRLGVPRSIRARFIAPAVCGFGTFSLIGFYAALAPTLLKERLQITNLAVGGAVVAELFVVSAIAMVATRRVDPSRAMLGGLWLLLPSLALLVASNALGSLALLLADTALIGACAALGYRGSLQVVNQIAPPERRAEVVSSYFVACFVGNSLPVIGIGALSAVWGSLAAMGVFAAIIGAFALAALAAGMKYRAA
jgi:predicted MFS family arabinose efflux permease